MAENLAHPTQIRRADSPGGGLPGTFGFAMASEVPQKFGMLPTAPACTRDSTFQEGWSERCTYLAETGGFQPGSNKRPRGCRGSDEFPPWWAGPSGDRSGQEREKKREPAPPAASVKIWSWRVSHCHVVHSQTQGWD